MTRRTYRSRQAFTLIEVLIVVTLMSLTLGLAATLLSASYRLQSRATDRKDLERSLAQLSLKLRQDAHAATSAEVVRLESGEQTLRLPGDDDTTVVYEARVGEVERRIETSDGQVLARDAFRFPRATTVNLSHKRADDSQAGGGAVTIELAPQASSLEHAGLPWRVTAALGVFSAPHADEEESP